MSTRGPSVERGYTGDLPAGSSPRMHDLARWIGTWCFRPMYRLRVHHLERVPAQGPVVVVANHSAFVDGPLLFGLLGRRTVFLVKQEMFHGPFAWILPRIGQVAVRRGAADRRPLTLALDVLRGGGLVAVFPEGTRTRRRRRGGPARGGVAGPGGGSGGAPGRVPGHATACWERPKAPPARGRAGGGAADRGGRRWPRRIGGGHRDHPGHLGRAGRGNRRFTENDVSAGQDDRAAMAQLGLDPDEFTVEATPPTPVLAVVGRPNVGKSTLVNRLIGRREAVVQDVPGVTRDRVAYDAMWNGRRFTLVDTGGWEPDATGLRAAVAAQAEYAMRTADAMLLVVDATVGATATDEAVARILRRSNVPVLLAATKVDDDRLISDTTALWRLGLGEPRPVSAACTAASPATSSTRSSRCCPRPPATTSAPTPPRARDASRSIGKPNVGKSSLLNRVSGEVRSVVHEVAGTTVDPVDSLVELDDEVWRFVDTAGLRKRVKHGQRHGVLRQPAHPGRDRGGRGRRSCSSTRASRSPSRTSA